MTFEPDPTPFVSDETVVDSAGRPVAVQPVEAVAVQPVPAVAVASVAPVAETVYAPQAAVRRSVATSYGRRYAFDSVIVGLIGLAYLIVGLVAMTRAGFDGSMREPVVSVVGFTHTATLGMIEAGIGLALLLCAATMTRGGSVFFGLLLGVAGVVGAVQTDSFVGSLALESGFAWLAVFAAVIVVLVSLLIPRMVTRTDRVEAI